MFEGDLKVLCWSSELFLRNTVLGFWHSFDEAELGAMFQTK